MMIKSREKSYLQLFLVNITSLYRIEIFATTVELSEPVSPDLITYIVVPGVDVQKQKHMLRDE